VPGELIVKFRASALGAPPVGSAALSVPGTARAVTAAMRARLAPHEAPGQAQIVGISPALLAARVRVADSGRLEEIASELRREPAVERVERNPLAWAFGRRVPNDPAYPWQAWHYGMIDLPEAWTITQGSAAAVVAVVDDGIRFDHPDVASNLTSDGRDFVSNMTIPLCTGGTLDNAGDGGGYDADPTIPASYSFNPNPGCATGPNTEGGHGLHVAGTIGALGNDGGGVTGVNWTVRIGLCAFSESLGQAASMTSRKVCCTRPASRPTTGPAARCRRRPVPASST